MPETLEYNVSSFIFHAKRPFHPERLWELVHESDRLDSVIRSKGFIWLATDKRHFYIWSQAGCSFRFSLGGQFWVETPVKEHPETLDKSEWHPTFGDRQQELVIIGIDMNKEEITKSLKSCLLTKKEMVFGMQKWRRMWKNPFQRALQAS